MFHSAAEEEEKRKYESLPGNNSFHAVGYSYTTDEYGEEEDCDNEPSQPSREYLTTSSVDVGEDDVFLLPQGLSVPGDIRLVGGNPVGPAGWCVYWPGPCCCGVCTGLPQSALLVWCVY